MKSASDPVHNRPPSEWTREEWSGLWNSLRYWQGRRRAQSGPDRETGYRWCGSLGKSQLRVESSNLEAGSSPPPPKNPTPPPTRDWLEKQRCKTTEPCTTT